ncbi:hypothetical protein F183_A26130 [Bryobacterales bacterium F-183]|nr:hypothetical protein F183_A26130 [Bryobacterales bacterium F-183]
MSNPSGSPTTSQLGLLELAQGALKGSVTVKLVANAEGTHAASSSVGRSFIESPGYENAARG